MSLAVIGAGLVSPGGITPRDHVFYLRAGLLVPAPSPFVKSDDTRVDIEYCPWLGARLPVADRLVRMARAAAHEALWDSEELLAGANVPLLLCTSRPRPGLTAADQRALADVMRRDLRPQELVDVWGAAGIFAALRDARARLDAGARAVLLLAVDSYVSLDAVLDEVEHPPSWWAIDARPLSEAAAAVLVVDSRMASRERLPVHGTIVDAQIALGAANDENDEVADGVGMTTALRALPIDGPVHAVFGQYHLDSMRRQEWLFAEARNASRFHPSCANITVETRVGRLGAAAGLFNVAYGISVLRYDTAELEVPPGTPSLAWAMSRDGARGAAVIKGPS